MGLRYRSNQAQYVARPLMGFAKRRSTHPTFDLIVGWVEAIAETHHK